ncbi:aminotransferase class III-fold pyridoxal phosphate-dependent enzyme [Gluconobacter frateurii]|uniref:aminotransferase class III-fold pyridoxal phosphate-dependent enzyme n=1 Tax=Gluconobacter frateurii TaxID=38308 RepID=UPI001F06BE44|nr:aminotransferase class III-fold pyridoxal phosphate-dependent enzyme [Gluconobacter frateurii]UMM08063.1 aminotransferase class III-fold pyridoxal phosphate-dependent enzyme [Gluconobacter frateurii]
MDTPRLVSLDREHLIHPVSSWQGHEASGATILESGKGVWLTDSKGNRLLDGFSGLWCVNTGYGCESVIEAGRRQLEKLPYATGYFGFSNEPAIELAARLTRHAPGHLNHIYFALGGSDAVDSTLRFIRYYQHARETPEKRHVIGLQKGYHGSSFVGAGLTALPVFHRNADVPLPWQHHIPSPDPYRHPAGPDAEAIIRASVQALHDEIAKIGGPQHVAAFYCELVQGSGGVIIPPKGWATAMQTACRELDILFVVDEVITGFGRTGPLFACAHENIEPDMMTVAKGLTAGYAPMGGVFMSDTIYETIRDKTPPGVSVGHGQTYSAHPVSAAIGLAVLDLYEGGLLENGTRVGEHLATRLRGLGNHPLVGTTRSLGMLAGIELVTDKATKTKPDAQLGISGKLSRYGYEQGILFRAFGDDVIGLAPPLCSTIAEMDQLCDGIVSILDRVMDDPAVASALKT